jgi:disulfide bond formation protein DsbB
MIGVSSFVAFLHRPSIRISKLYSFFIALFAVAGAWISARQVWLQGLPEDEVPLCGPPLEYIVDVFPFVDVLNALFMGDGNCAEIPWQFLGLSMAGWSLIWFIVIISLSLFALLKNNLSD